MSQTNKNILSGVAFALKAYTLKELSELYGVSEKTFRKWLSPFKEAIGEKRGYFYTIGQVKQILEFLGVPGNIMIE